MPDRKLVLDGAAEAVLRQRNKSYGEPDEDFQRIAAIASAMGFRFTSDGSTRPLTGADVSLFMIALKTSRLTWSPDHQDSWTDIAGYAACGFETARLQAAREATNPLAPMVKPDGGDREGARRLGVSEVEWQRLKELADKVQNGATPDILQNQGFMIMTQTLEECDPRVCTLARGQQVHSYADRCHYRIRPRRMI